MLRVEAMSAEILREFGKGNKLRTLVSANAATKERSAAKYRRTDASTSDAKSGIAFVKAEVEKPPREPLPETASQNHKKFYNMLSAVVGFSVGEHVNYGNSLQKTFQEHKEGQFNEQIEGLMYECSYNGKLLVRVVGPTAKKAKSEGMEKVYRILKNYCPFLVRKASYCAENDAVVQKGAADKVEAGPKKKAGPETFESNKLGADNIGYRMLKALGWEENKNRGIVDPIGLSVKIGRKGLGSEPNQAGGGGIDVKYFRELLTNFERSESDFDLVFSSEFTKEERAQLHAMAQKMHLKTKSEGKDEERFLVVRRKVSLSPWEVVNKVRAEDPFYSAVWTIEQPEMKEYNELDI